MLRTWSSALSVRPPLCPLFCLGPRGARGHRGPGPASGGGAGRLSAESSAKILSKPKRTESRPAWPPCASRGAIARVQKRALFYAPPAACLAPEFRGLLRGVLLARPKVRSSGRGR